MNPSTPQSILELARNFMESRVLLTGAEMNLFTLLASEPLSAEEVASRTGANIRSLTILLDALAAMELLVKQGGRYSCPPAIASLLSEKGPESILPMVHHMAHVWQRWSQLTERVRGREEPGKPAESQEANQIPAFIGAMHSIAAKLAPGIVAAVNPGTARNLLDVGGASGTYTLAFLRAVPEMRATLFDKPEVIPIARRRLGEAAVLDRITLVGGDYYRDEFPPGHDLALISAIIHQNSPGENLDLYRKVFRALVPGGRIVIRDHIMEPDRTRPRDGAIFAVNRLVGTRGGNTYTFEEIHP
ncbi:MAG: methyltransferase, partial [Deltaproteobacteria bacterium]|nr:methyltransferase [Deltaproteobacteria bacterium]